MIMAKAKVNYQEVYDLYQLCSETKDLREFCADYGVNYDNGLWSKLRQVHELAASSAVEREVRQDSSG